MLCWVCNRGHTESRNEPFKKKIFFYSVLHNFMETASLVIRGGAFPGWAAHPERLCLRFSQCGVTPALVLMAWLGLLKATLLVFKWNKGPSIAQAISDIVRFFPPFLRHPPPPPCPTSNV